MIRLVSIIINGILLIVLVFVGVKADNIQQELCNAESQLEIANIQAEGLNYLVDAKDEAIGYYEAIVGINTEYIDSLELHIEYLED